MNDNYAKFEFEIEFLHTCHESNGDSVYTVSVGKIYSYLFISHTSQQTRYYSILFQNIIRNNLLSKFQTHLAKLIKDRA